MNLKTRENTARLMIAIVLLAVFVLFGQFFGFYYAANDDISMRSIAAGGFMGRPDAHLVFIDFALGTVLAALFRLQGQVDWYGLMMVGGSYVCLLLIILRTRRCCAGVKNAPWFYAALAIILSLCFARSVLFFQFTTFSGILAGTATFLLLTRKEDERFGSCLIPVVLFWLSALVRRNVCFLFLPVSALIVCCDLFKLLRTKPANWKRTAARLFSSTLVLVLLIAASEVIESKAYSAPEWMEYTRYRHSRSRILDYEGFPPYLGNEESWAEIGVTEEERGVIEAFGILPDIDADKIEKISVFSQSQRAALSPLKRARVMLGLLRSVAVMPDCIELNYLIFIAILLVALLWKRLLKEEKLLVGLGGAAELGILLYLLYMGRMPARIVTVFDWGCILCALGLALRLAAGDRLEETRSERMAAIFLMLLLLAACIPVARKLGKEQGNYRENIVTYDAYSALQNDPDFFYVRSTGVVTTVKQFKLIGSGKENTVAFSCGTRGWSSRMPLLEEKKQLFGIEPDEHIFLKDRVLFIDDDTKLAEAFDRYFHSIGINASHEIVRTAVLPNGKEVLMIRWQASSQPVDG